MVTGVDMAIGEILKKLETENMLDDTLIVFMSGPWRYVWRS